MIFDSIRDAGAVAPLAFLQNLGWPELVVIGILAILLFGRKLPDIGRSLGQTYVQFRRGLRDVGDDVAAAHKTPDAPSAPSAPAPAPAAAPAASTVSVTLDQVGDRPDAVRDALAGLMGSSAEDAARLCAAPPVAVGRDVPLGVARQMKATLEAAGARVSLS